MKRFFKAIALLFTMALLSIVVSLQTIVSSNPFKQQLVKSLTANIPGEIQLGQISLDFTKGVEVGVIQWHLTGTTQLQLERMVLDVVWLDLLQGQLTIREIHFLNGRITASQADLDSTTVPQSNLPAINPPPIFALSPARLPMQLDMQSLRLKGINLDFMLTSSQRVALKNLSVQAAFRINHQGLDLKGSLTIDSMSFADAQGELVLPLTLDFNLAGDLQKQGLRSTESRLRLGDLAEIPLEIEIKTDHDPAELHATIHAKEISLPTLLAMADPWVPLKWRPATLDGQISPKLTLTGLWQNDGFHGHITGEAVIDHLIADIPHQELKIKAQKLRLALTDMDWQANQLKKVTTEINLSAADLTWEKQQADTLSWLLVADYQPNGEMAGHMRIKANRVTPFLPNQPATPFPFDAIMLGGGNLSTKAIVINNLFVKAGDLLHIKGSGNIAPASATKPEWQLSGKLQSELDGAQLTHLLPKQLLTGTALQLKAGKSRFTMQGETTLDADWMPQHLDSKGSITLMPFALQQAEYGLQTDIQALELSWQANQALLGDPVQAQLTGATRFDATTLQPDLAVAGGDLMINMVGQFIPEKRFWINTVTLNSTLHQPLFGQRLMMDQLQTQLEARIKGILTSEKTWQMIEIKEDLQTKATNLTATDSTTQLKLPEVTLALNGINHLREGDYQLKTVKLTADKTTNATLTGQYLAQTDHFELSGTLNPLMLAKLSEYITINETPWLGESQLIGQVEMQFDSTGTLTTLQQWDGRTLPMAATLKLQGRDLGGRWQESPIKGGTGTLQLKLQPTKNNQLNLTANLQAKQLQLAESDTKQSLKNLLIDLDLTSEAMDSLRVNRCQASLPGLQATTSGKIFGAARLLSQQGQPAEQLAPLFVDLSSQVTLDLAKQPPFLTELTIQGQGQSQLDLQLTKSINAPFKLQFTSALKDLSLKQTDLLLTKAAGKFTGVKTLWLEKKAVPVSKRIRRAFALDRITTSPAWGSQDQRIHIESLTVGAIQVRSIGLTLGFHENTIHGKNLEMSLLGGTIGGNLLIDGVKSSRIDAIIEGVGIDLNQLFTDTRQITGDSSVDFVSRYTLHFDRQTTRLNWGRTEINLIFTRIGKEALDRLLLFLDPKESNPAIVNARAKLSYANPASLDLQLTKGTIKLVINFHEGVVSTLKIERIPLKLLGHFEQIQTALHPLEAFIRSLETISTPYLDLTRYENKIE